MMVRTQILLDSEGHRRAKARAAELGVSLAEYVRRLVDADVGVDRRRADASSIIGLFDSGGSNIAGEKKDALADAFADKLRRSHGSK